MERSDLQSASDIKNQVSFLNFLRRKGIKEKCGKQHVAPMSYHTESAWKIPTKNKLLVVISYMACAGEYSGIPLMNQDLKNQNRDWRGPVPAPPAETLQGSMVKHLLRCDFFRSQLRS